MNAKVSEQFWRYYLPSIKGEGWAVVFMDTKGVFSAVSDFGNYGYIWSHISSNLRDVREFIVTAHSDWDYFARKFAGGKEITDWDATEKGIKEHIHFYRKEGRYTKEFAQTELERLERCNITSGELEFHDWYLKTKLEDPGEFLVRRLPYQVEHFCKKILPRLSAAIIADVPEYDPTKPRAANTLA